MNKFEISSEVLVNFSSQEAKEAVFLEIYIKELFQKAKIISPQTPANEINPLIFEFTTLYESKANLFSMLIEKALLSELAVEAKDTKELTERINLLHLLYFNVLPLFSKAVNHEQLNALCKKHIVENIDKYQLLEDEQADTTLHSLCDQIKFRANFPGFYEKYHEYLKVLETLNNNLSTQTLKVTKYTFKTFDTNLNLLIKGTKTIVVPLKTLDARLTKHINDIFFHISFLQHWHNALEAETLLLKAAELLNELSIKLAVKENSANITHLADRIHYLAAKTTKAVRTVQSEHLTPLDHPELSDEELVVDEKLLDDTLELLFTEDIKSISRNKKVQLLFKSNLEATEILSKVVIERIKKHFHALPSINSTIPLNLQQILENQSRIDLSFYFINTIVKSKPELQETRLELLLLFYKQISYHFIAVNKYLKHREHYTEQDESLLTHLLKTHNDVESLLTESNRYILEQISLIEINPKPEAKDRARSNIFEVIHGILGCKLSLIISCSFLEKYNLISIHYENLKVTSFEAEQIFDKLNKTLSAGEMKIFSEMIDELRAKQKEIKNLTNQYKHFKANAIKSGRNIQGFNYQSQYLIPADIDHICDDIKNVTKDALPENNNETYGQLTNTYQKEFNSKQIREALSKRIFTIYENDSLSELTSSTTTPDDKIKTIKLRQNNINVLYACYSTFVKTQAERFPTENVSLNFIKLMIFNMYMQAKEVELLIIHKNIPNGSYSLIYQYLHANFKVFQECIDFYQADALKSSISGTFSTLLDLHLIYTLAFYDYADPEFSNTAFKRTQLLIMIMQKNNILPLNDILNIQNQLIAIKSYEVSFSQFAHNRFKILCDNELNIKNLLDNLSDRQPPIIPTPVGQSLFIIFNTQIASSKFDIIELIDSLLRIHQDFGLYNLIELLKNYNVRFKEIVEKHFSEKSGWAGILAESLHCIVIDVTKCIATLENHVEALKANEARMQREQAQLLEKQLAKEKRALAEKEKKEARQLAQRLTKERKLLQHQIKMQTNIENKKLAQEKVSASEQEQSESKSLTKAIPQQRAKQAKQLVVTEETSSAYIEKEPKLSKKKQRAQLKFEKEELERQERISKQKIYRSQMRRMLSSQSAATALDQEPIKPPKRKKNKKPTLALTTNDNQKLNDLIIQTEKLSVQDERCAPQAQDLPDQAYILERKIKLSEKIKGILDTFHERGLRAFLYGGYPRDKMLGREPHDADIVVFCSRGTLETKLGEKLIVNNNNPAQQFIYEGEDVRCEEQNMGLVEFTSNLDFTANALLADRHGNVYAPNLHSISDLNNKELRTIGDPMKLFTEDPVKMYRAMILSSSLFNTMPSDRQQQALIDNAKWLTCLTFPGYKKNFTHLFLRSKAQLTINYLLELNLIGDLLSPLKELELNETDMAWFNSECLKIDETKPSEAKELYPFYKLIAIFLAPLVLRKITKQFDLGLQASIEQICAEFQAMFSDVTPQEIKILSKYIEYQYAQYLYFTNSRAKMFKSQELALPVTKPASVYLPRYQHESRQSPALKTIVIASQSTKKKSLTS